MQDGATVGRTHSLARAREVGDEPGPLKGWPYCRQPPSVAAEEVATRAASGCRLLPTDYLMGVSSRCTKGTISSKWTR